MANSGWTNDQPLSLIIGSIPGQHFIINNPATGDIIDAYNTNNQLVMKMDSLGDIVEIFPVSGDTTSLDPGGLVFQNQNTPPVGASGGITGMCSNVSCEVTLVSGDSVGTGSNSTIDMRDANGSNGLNKSIIFVTQRNTNAGLVGVQGCMVQTGDVSGVNNFTHAGSYSGTTNASGHVVVTHNCGFTPTMAVVTGTAPGGTFANLTCGVDNLTATQADINWTVASTGAAFANSAITFNAVFFG